MSETHVVKEEFGSIGELMDTLKSRPNNKHMKNQNSSRSNDKSFTGSESYEEAEQLIRTGYTEILPKVKEKMAKMEKSLQTEFIKVPKMRPRNAVVGYVPNVPNALLGLPESMINSDRFTQKQKTIDIMYIMGGNCGTDAKLWIDAGIVLLSAIKILESNRISVKLKVCFMPSESGDELMMPSVLIKDYAQRLDLQKICFPMAHPSMFRRIGFKWLETTPDMTDDGFAWGYGRSPSDTASAVPRLIEKAGLDKDQRIISAQIIKEMGYDISKLMLYLKTNQNGKSDQKSSTRRKRGS